MPDPWLEGDDLAAHEEEVANHPLTEEAKALADQADDLQKLREERAEQAANEAPSVSVEESVAGSKPAQESGYAADQANSGIGPSGEGQQAPPAGNLESTQPTQKEVEEANDKGDAENTAATKKSQATKK